MSRVDEELKLLNNLKYGISKRKVTSIKKSIESDYHNEIEKIKKLHDRRLEKLDEFGKTIEEYSTFRLREIGPVIADLFTLYNGEVYEFNSKNIGDGIVEFFIGSATNKKKKTSIMCAYYNELQYYLKINFYEYSDYYGALFSEKFLSYYPYLKEFINFVIEYRFNNQLKNIDGHHLEKCLHDFVILHKEEIEEIQKNVIDEQKGEYGAALKLALAKPYLDRKTEIK